MSYAAFPLSSDRDVAWDKGMTTQRIRMLTTVFAIMSIGVAINLAAFQPRIGSGGAKSQVVSDAAPLAGEAGAESGTHEAHPRKGEALVEAVARELVRADYLSDVSDAEDMTLLRAAIFAFEYDHGMGLTATASNALLETLLFGRARAPGVSLKPRTRNARQLVGLVQTALANLGYDLGSIDGELGPRTQAAIERFEKKVGLPVTKRVSAPLVARLADMARVDEARVRY